MDPRQMHCGWNHRWQYYSPGRYPFHGFHIQQQRPIDPVVNYCYPSYPCSLPIQRSAHQPLPSYTHTHFSTLQQASEERVPVIIQFKIPALLEKFPRLSEKERFNHPYLNQLKQKYSDWLNQIREKTPTVHLRHVYNLLVSGIAATLWKEDVKKLKSLPFIKAIYPDEKTTEDTKKCGFPLYRTPRAYLNQTNLNQHNLDIIGVPHVHAMLDKADQPLDGRGIRVAVLEHGFDLQHLRFGPEGKIIDQYSFEKNNGDVFTPDDSEHGTTVTQIILDVAPNAHILAYKTRSTSEIIAVLERAIDHSAQIINISLRPTDKFNPIIQAANTAVENGVIVVNSAGNDATKDEVSVPGTASFVLSVGATNQSGNQVAGFSNYDASLLKPDVVAPGYYQLDSKIVKNGTSYAAPYVSGSIALLLQKHPNWNPSEVMSALATTATPIREKNSSTFFSQGSGRINVFKGIQTDTFISPLHMIVQVFPNQTIQATLDIENSSNFEKEYHFHLDDKDIPSSISMTLPSQITVPPQETEKIPFSIGASPNTPSTEKYFGRIQLISDTTESYIPILLDIRPITFHVPDLYSVALSPNGKLIASASENKKIQLWDVTTGNQNPVLSFEIGEDIYSLSFSPNGQFIASGSKNKIQLWDITSDIPQLIHSFDADGNIFSISFHPDKQLIASGSGNKVQLWNIDSGQLVYSFDVGDSVVSVAFSPNGTFIASGSHNHKVQLWDIDSDQLVHSFDAGDIVHSIAFSPNGQFIASGSDNKKIQLWDLSSRNPKPVHSINVDGHVEFVSFSPNGQFIAAGSDNHKVQLWDLSSRNPKPVHSFDVGDVGATVFFVAFSPDGQFITSGSYNDTIQLWNAQLPIYSFNVRSSVNSVAFSPDDRYIASGSGNNEIQLWDLSSRNPLPVYSFHVGNNVTSVSFSPNGQFIASGSYNNKVQVWNIDSGQLVRSFDVGATVFSVAFSPDGTFIASGSNNNKVQVWNVDSGQLVHFFDVGGSVESIAFSPDGHYVASGSSNKIQLWDITSGSAYPIYSFDVNEVVWSVAFSPNGQLIASGSSNNTVPLWSIDSGQLIHSFDLGATVYSVSFSPDGQYIAFGLYNNKVQVRNIDSGQLVHSFDAGDTVFSVAFSSDGHYVASGSGNNKVQLWRM